MLDTENILRGLRYGAYVTCVLYFVRDATFFLGTERTGHRVVPERFAISVLGLCARSSEEEDEDGALPEKTESQFAETLAKLRRKDPEIYKVGCWVLSGSFTFPVGLH